MGIKEARLVIDPKIYIENTLVADKEQEMNSGDIKKKHDSEMFFFDKTFGQKKQGSNLYDLGFKSIITNKFIKKLGNLEGKKVLELGCGRGWFTKILATMGAEVWTFDISAEAVRETRSMAEKLNFQDKVHVGQMPAEKLTYDSGMFDIVVGNAILHHLDLNTSVKQIRRVLRKGGKASFMEPLGHNPLLNLYRWITPHLRTDDEAPMLIEQFTIFEDNFTKFEHEEYYLTALFALLWYIIGVKSQILRTRDFLFRLDELILKAFPFAKRYCWYSILEFEK